METIEYKNPSFDKSRWGEGEWSNEPDKKQWLDEETGLPCLIVRSEVSGALCGYVGVSKEHRYYEKGYDGIDVEVHGGLTFSGKCQETQNECEGVCHKAPEGQDDIWWLGFDCAHSWDLSPRLGTLLIALHLSYPEGSLGETYRNFAYVTKEVQKLAKALA